MLFCHFKPLVARNGCGGTATTRQSLISPRTAMAACPLRQAPITKQFAFGMQQVAIPSDHFLNYKGHARLATAVAFSLMYYGRHIVSDYIKDNRTICLWDTASGELVTNPKLQLHVKLPRFFTRWEAGCMGLHGWSNWPLGYNEWPNNRMASNMPYRNCDISCLFARCATDRVQL